MTRSNPTTVIPAKAGTHGSTGRNVDQLSVGTVGPGLRRDDGGEGIGDPS